MAASCTHLLLLLVATALASSGASSGPSASASACSAAEASAAESLASALQQLFAGQLTRETAPADVPPSCVAAFQGADKEGEARMCGSDCASWLQAVLARDACGLSAMEDALVETAGALAECQARRRRLASARELERQAHKTARNMRGLAPEAVEASPDQRDGRKLSVKGLMDAILVLTLNQGL